MHPTIFNTEIAVAIPDRAGVTGSTGEAVNKNKRPAWACGLKAKPAVHGMDQGDLPGQRPN